MAPPWPPGFVRIPDDAWTAQPLDALAKNYDTVERHGWYDNLDPTVDELAAAIRDGDIYLDYSGGTGILIDRLLQTIGGRDLGIINIDSSPKFLRLSLEKFRNDERVGFRLIRYLEEARRLQYVDEVLGEPLLKRGVDGLVSTNAIHLYYDLQHTLQSWNRVLRPSGRVFIQSGNIGSVRQTPGTWIIDETVHAMAEAAETIVREDADGRWARYLERLEDPDKMTQYERLRRKYFLPVREVSYYVGQLEATGFAIESVVRRPIHARKSEWLEFLQVYHEGILGWVGGAKKVDGHGADEQAVQDRLTLMKEAADRVFPDEVFQAEWTYITGIKT